MVNLELFEEIDATHEKFTILAESVRTTTIDNLSEGERHLQDLRQVSEVLRDLLYEARRELESAKEETLGAQKYDLELLQNHINSLKKSTF